MHVVVDADTLEYISSAGLRIILRLRKDDANLAIINVSHEVYDAKSISKHMIANPDDISTYVDYFVDTLKHIHSIKVKKGELRDYKDWVVGYTRILRRSIRREEGPEVVAHYTKQLCELLDIVDDLNI